MRIFLQPLLYNILCLFGLLFALIGNHLWDMASWLLLATPLLVIARHWWRFKPQA